MYDKGEIIMAGKLYTGTPTNNAGPANLRESKAFCEGMFFRSQGTAIAFPITGNPFNGDGSEAEASWNSGWTTANTAAGGTISVANQACCSVSTTILA